MDKREAYMRAKLEITEFTQDDIYTEYDRLAASSPASLTPGQDESTIIALGRPVSGLGRLNGNR